MGGHPVLSGHPSGERGMNTPTLSLPPRRGRVKVGGDR